jgi:hypothetical protein
MKALILLAVLTMVGTALAAPGEAEPKKKDGVCVTLTVPDGSWSMSLTEAREVDGEVWVMAQLTKAPGMAIMMLRVLTETLDLDPGDRDVRVLVAGKAWKWPNKEAYTFLSEKPEGERKKILKAFQAGQRLHPPE